MFPTPLWKCGQIEPNFHYFFECSNLTKYRQKLFQRRNNVNIIPNILHFGNPDIPDTDNATIFKYVLNNISITKRFL
jgi:hypothetical protein